jgi:hypothetical protein
MEIKQEARDRMELRIHAEETLRAIITWIDAVKPSEWLPSKSKDMEDVITPDELKAQWRDFVDKASKLITKVWKPAELLVDDLVSFMEETCAKSKGTSESK